LILTHSTLALDAVPKRHGSLEQDEGEEFVETEVEHGASLRPPPKSVGLPK
jgi:hypothetical protein